MSGLSEAMSVLPVEQRTIVRQSADNLREEFRGTFGVETIELYLASSLLSLQAARIKNSVPLSRSASHAGGSAPLPGWRGR
jgi:hypothetical protein